MLNFIRKKTKTTTDYNTFFTSRELEAINRLIEDVARTLDLDIVLQKSVDSAVDLLNLHGGILFLKDKEGKHIYTKTMAKSIYSKRALELLRIDNMMDQLKVSLNQRDNLVVDTVINDKDNESNELWKFTIGVLDKNLVNIIQRGTLTGNVLVVPIKYREDTIGALLLSKRSYNEGFEKELPIIRIYSNQIAIAITNARLFQEKAVQIKLLQQQNHDLESLYILTSNVSKSLDPDIVAQTAVDSLPQDTNMIGAVLSLHDPKKNELYIKAITRNELSYGVEKIIGGFAQYTVKLDGRAFENSLSRKAFLEDNVFSTTDLADFISPPVPKAFVKPIEKLLSIRSVVSFPLKRRDQVIGTINYFLKDDDYQELGENEKQLYSTYTYQISIALENAFLLKNLELAKAQIEEAYRKEKDMMDILGHELRTPLTTVRNAILMMDMEYKKPEPRLNIILDMLEKAKENVRREIATLQSVLSTTRLENDRVQINYEKVDAKDVINDSLDALRAQAEKKKLKLTTEFPSEDVFIWGGREQVQEIVDNLLSNAIKYTHQGSVDVKLEVEYDYVKIKVTDTGEGIPQEEIPNLGKKFHRVNPYISSDNSNSFKVVRPGGTGIGLYVVTGYLKAMGGKLDIESKVGEGSTFTAYLQVYKNQDKEPK